MSNKFRKASAFHRAIASSASLANAVRFSRMISISRSSVGTHEYFAAGARHPTRSNRLSQAAPRAAGIVASTVGDRIAGRDLTDSDSGLVHGPRARSLNSQVIPKLAELLRTLRWAARSIQQISPADHRSGLPYILAVQAAAAQRLPIHSLHDTASIVNSRGAFAARDQRRPAGPSVASGSATRIATVMSLATGPKSARRITFPAVALNQWRSPKDAAKLGTAFRATQTREKGAHRGGVIEPIVAQFITRAADAIRGLNAKLRALGQAAHVGTFAANAARASRTPFTALRRAAAAAAIVAPTILAGAASGAFAAPTLFSNQSRIVAEVSRHVPARPSIVVNYSPNLTIHAQDSENDQAMARRVMEILEHHGRQLHQVLARELIRRQRMEFDG